MRTVLEQVIWRGVKVAVIHLERLKDIFVDIDLVIVAAQFLDYLSQKDYPRVRVAEFAARLKEDLGIRQHRDKLFVSRRLERLPVLALGPRPRAAPKPG